MNDTNVEFQDSILKAVAEVVGERKVGLHEPTFHGNEQDYVRDCIDSTYVSSVGKYVTRFEQELAQYVGVDHAIAVVNGTSALHLALLICGVEEGDEVLIPSLTFIATANAVKYIGAIPHFVDSEEESLGIDPAKLSDYLRKISRIESGKLINKMSGRTISALIPMHTFGHAGKMAELAEVAEQFNLVIVEDAAEALGTKYNGVHVGGIGKVGILSFNGNKIVTTGGGGAILTNSTFLADKARHLSTTAKVSHAWRFTHDEIGYNYRMPNINAALGCAQLESIDSKVSKKRELFKKYQTAFAGILGVKIFEAPKHSYSNYWLQSLVVDSAYVDSFEEILRKLNQQGFMSRPLWEPLHSLEIFSNSPRMDLSTVNKIHSQIINLPSSPQLIDSK